MEHSDECLKIRYCQLSDDDRDCWPSAFLSREDLCTCDANPDEGKQAALTAEVTELREYIESRER